MSAQDFPRTWIEISLPRLQANWTSIRTAIPRDCGIVAVLKANAYGHCAKACGAVLRNSGATWFGVSSPAEGRRLRAVCPDENILLLSYLGDECRDVVDSQLIPVIWEPRQADLLEVAWRNYGGKQSIPVHIEFDTGMARRGVRSTTELDQLVEHCTQLPFLRIEGAITHFCSPETLQPDHTLGQITRFRAFLDCMSGHGVALRYIHAGESATAFVPKHVKALQALGNRYGAIVMIRPGMALAGHTPRLVPKDGVELPSLKPILAWKTRVVSLRELEAGETAGYDMTFRALRPTRLALIPVGYADGLNRLLSNKGSALVRGMRAPYAGLISMDLTLLDVTDVPAVSIGDEVVLIGEQGGDSVTAYEVADMIGTIPDEVTCMIGSHVPRIFRD